MNSGHSGTHSLRAIGIPRGAALRPAALAAALLMLAGAVHPQTCSPGALATPKRQAMYLFFPTASSNVTVAGTTYTVGRFDVADLDATIGTTAQLRDRIFQIVRDSYCELSVEVKQTTAVPAPAEARFEIVGVGSDVGGGEFGNAYEVDIGDAHAQNFARVFAQQFHSSYGGTGGALDGANSTLERWATCIGGTSAHEPGHNYGLMHENAQPRAGTTEDAVLNHVMATSNDFGSTTFERGDNRARRIRHFSDTSFEILGHNIGLTSATLSNWDFVNPNNTNATTLRMRLLSSASSLTLGWVYSSSPWTNPTLAKQPGTQNFQNVSYSIYDLTFSTPQAWSGGAAGTVPPGVKFHVGASVSSSVIVYEVTLGDGSGDLPLKPRMFGYDAGTATTDGDFSVAFFNPNPRDGDLILRDVRILFLPRGIDINNMVQGGELISREGLRVTPFPRQPASVEGTTRPTRVAGPQAVAIQSQIRELTVGGKPVSVPIARLSDRRHVDRSYDRRGCEPGVRTPAGLKPYSRDIDVGEVVYCPEGAALSLFPATYTYVMATVVDPKAKYWDPAQGRFVTGPLESHLYYQLAGIVPDLNHNGTDDLIDIRTGKSRDANGNGVPDEAEGRKVAASARIGLAAPHSSGLDPGVSLNLGLEYYVTPNATLEGVLGYHRLGVAGHSAALAVWQLSLNSRYYVPRPGPLKPFVNAGAGGYFLRPGNTEFGLNVGTGLHYELRPPLAFEAAYNYHHVGPGGANVKFSTIQVGLWWRF